MRCLNCKISRKHIVQECWQKWQLCGLCAPLKHPEAYPKNIINKSIKQPQPKLPKIKFPTCKTCSNRTYTLQYRSQDKGKTKAQGVGIICPTCKIITTSEKELKLLLI
tara:strand:- start:701 stop:1024 length:324 start_codon:yes stop_codon:yes gene_type:complete